MVVPCIPTLLSSSSFPLTVSCNFLRYSANSTRDCSASTLKDGPLGWTPSLTQPLSSASALWMAATCCRDPPCPSCSFEARPSSSSRTIASAVLCPPVALTGAGAGCPGLGGTTSVPPPWTSWEWLDAARSLLTSSSFKPAISILSVRFSWANLFSPLLPTA